jgi:hypothetical protein
MRLVQHLRERGVDDHLTGELGIAVKRHRELPHLVLFKYNQITSPMAHPIVQECRGVILDESEGWRVVARPYDKFFNAGEPHAAALDWRSARVYEKLDGSLMTLFFYGGEWRVASSGNPDAAGEAGRSGKTFGEIFWEIFRAKGYRAPGDPGRCYMFELMTPETRVVVRHDTPRLVLHGVRRLATMAEEEPEPAAVEHGWEAARSYPLGSLAEVIEAARELDPMAGEGFVVRDAAFQRLKIKSPRYVAAHHAKDGLTRRGVLEVVLSGEESEVVSYFPELKAEHDEMRDRLDAFIAEIEGDYARLAHIEGMKEFALEALRLRTSPALFALKRAKAKTAREFVRVMSVDRLLADLYGESPAEER